MNVRFNNTKHCKLPISILQKYNTVRIVKAIIPMSYYNVSRELENNYIRFATVDESTTPPSYVDEQSVTIPDGLYTPITYNKAIQKALKKIGFGDKMTITYLKNEGKIHIKVAPQFAVYLHPKLCDMLGIPYSHTYTLKAITGDRPCQFLTRHEYRIRSNLVDTKKNIMNGEFSDMIASFVSKGKQIGDIDEYSSVQKVAIDYSYDFSHIDISIQNQNGEDIEFKSPFSIDLLLE